MEKKTESNFPLRNPDGTFPEKTSGNQKGRPKGSRNKITLMKLMAEEAYREDNQEKIQQVINKVVDKALKGDKACIKLVWSSVISNSPSDNKAQAQEKVVIKIDSMPTIEKNTEKEVSEDPELIEHEE